MGLISWIKGLFAKPEVIDPPAKTYVAVDPGYATQNSVLIVSTTSVPATKKPKKTKKKPKETKAKKVRPVSFDEVQDIIEEAAKKPKKARKPRAKKAPVEVIEEVTIEEIGENYADAAKIESEDETKLSKKDE